MQNPIKIPMALITETEPKKSSNLYGTIKDPEKPHAKETTLLTPNNSIKC